MMTTVHSPILFGSNDAIRRIGDGLVARTLPRSEWTHEAHLAACLYLLCSRPDIDVDRDIAEIISRYNESVGGTNDDTQGYHETITRVYVHGVRLHLNQHVARTGLADSVNALLLSAIGKRDWPLRFYSRETLFSVAARREFVAPDLAPLPPLW